MWDEVTATCLVLVDEEGLVVDPAAKNVAIDNTGLMIHSRVHRKLGAAATVVLHTHMPYATALCCEENGRLQMIHQNSLPFYEEVVYDSQYNGFVLDVAEGDRIADLMWPEGRERPFSVNMHANHGVIVVGATVAEGFERLYYLERCARQQLLAGLGSSPLKLVDRETCLKYAEQRALKSSESHSLGSSEGGDETNAQYCASLFFAAVRRMLVREGHTPFES
jgi:ribulose-5-phosphate 4-epimerase/fuculose-1-phosphate aldolase